MIVGFDYGSSNCAVATMVDEQNVKMLELEAGRHYLPSTLYAQHNSLVVDFVAKQLADTADAEQYRHSRAALLSGISGIRKDLDLANNETGLHIGSAAIAEYIDFPEDGYFVKSPKSFFGAIGLKPQQIAFFEDIATAMIMQIKQRAERQLGQNITHTVIGRPVNFQAIGGEQSNQQALIFSPQQQNERVSKRLSFCLSH